jgi:hypothetical protein
MATSSPANEKRKLQSYTIDFKLKILAEVDKKDCSKTKTSLMEFPNPREAITLGHMKTGN